MDSPYRQELVAAIRAVRLAARISRTVLSQAQGGRLSVPGSGGGRSDDINNDGNVNSENSENSNSSSVLVKDDLSPVTVADFAIQALLTTYLGSIWRGDGFVGEESADDLRANPALLQRVLDVLELCCPVLSIPDHDDGSDGGDESKKNGSGGGGATPHARRWTAESVCEKIDSCTVITSLQGGSGSGEGEEGEGEGDGNGDGGGKKRVWIFDPIDGTKTFMRGQQYAINVALVDRRGGKQILGVVGCPLLDMDSGGIKPGTTTTTTTVSDKDLDETGRGTILFAVRGYGSWVLPLREELEEEEEEEEGDDDDTKKREKTTTPPRRLPQTDGSKLRSVTCWEKLDSGIDPVHELVAQRLGMDFPGCDLLGWVPRWSVLALGLANTTVWVYKKRERVAKIWDHAGAMLLFEETGGKITDVHGKDIDLSLGRKLKENFGFVAAPRERHQEVLTTLQEILREQGKEELLV